MPYKDPAHRRARQAVYREANREKIRAQQRNRHAAIRDQKAAYRRAYYLANRETLLAQMREKHAANPGPKRTRARAWRLEDPARAAEQRKLYRYAIRDSDSQDYADALRQDPCSYCGDPAGDIDHITPRSSGGADYWTNFTAACRRCNSSKNAHALLPWLLSLPL